jgi:hypothetical protein
MIGGPPAAMAYGLANTTYRGAVPQKKPASAIADTGRLRVANPRQGDFAKPDCGECGRRPAAHLREIRVASEIVPVTRSKSARQGAEAAAGTGVGGRQ